MKVLGIVGSYRRKGNTELLVREALRGAEELGAQVDLLFLRELDVRPCDGCYSCRRKGICHIRDDMQKVYIKLLDSQGIIFGTPVYMRSMCGQMKVFLDRITALGYPVRRLANRVGGVITVAERTGHSLTNGIFQFFFSSHRMIATDHVSGLAREKGEILKDSHAMKAARELGKQMVLLIQSRFAFPEEYKIPLYRYVDEKYGCSPCPYHSPVKKMTGPRKKP